MRWRQPMPRVTPARSASRSLTGHFRVQGPGGREHRHELAILPADQVVDRDAKSLDGNVVEGDIDGRLDGHQDAVALEILASLRGARH